MATKESVSVTIDEYFDQLTKTIEELTTKFGKIENKTKKDVEDFEERVETINVKIDNLRKKMIDKSISQNEIDKQKRSLETSIENLKKRIGDFERSSIQRQKRSSERRSSGKNVQIQEPPPKRQSKTIILSKTSQPKQDEIAGLKTKLGELRKRLGKSGIGISQDKKKQNKELYQSINNEITNVNNLLLRPNPHIGNLAERIEGIEENIAKLEEIYDNERKIQIKPEEESESESESEEEEEEEEEEGEPEEESTIYNVEPEIGISELELDVPMTLTEVPSTETISPELTESQEKREEVERLRDLSFEREIETKIKTLESENASLKNQIKTLTTQVQLTKKLPTTQLEIASEKTLTSTRTSINNLKTSFNKLIERLGREQQKLLTIGNIILDDKERKAKLSIYNNHIFSIKTRTSTAIKFMNIKINTLDAISKFNDNRLYDAYIQFMSAPIEVFEKYMQEILTGNENILSSITGKWKLIPNLPDYVSIAILESDTRNYIEKKRESIDEISKDYEYGFVKTLDVNVRLTFTNVFGSEILNISKLIESSLHNLDDQLDKWKNLVKKIKYEKEILQEDNQDLIIIMRSIKAISDQFNTSLSSYKSKISRSRVDMIEKISSVLEYLRKQNRSDSEYGKHYDSMVNKLHSL